MGLLLETLTLEDLNKDVFATLVYNPWGVLAIVLVGPFTEELVFRMGIQRHLIRYRMRPWMAILLSALIFGAVHGNPAQIPGAVVFGWVLGWLYWRSGTIWIPVVAHVFNNFVGGVREIRIRLWWSCAVVPAQLPFGLWQLRFADM